MENKCLIKKIGILTLSTILLGSCSTQGYLASGHSTARQECKNSIKISKKDYKKFERLESKYKNAIKKGVAKDSPKFMELSHEYEFQKAMLGKNEGNVLVGGVLYWGN